MAIYVALKSLYVSPQSLKDQEDDVLVAAEWLTHFSRGCKKLGIKIIKASAPQATGRVERSHAVDQDRFVKELRLKGVCTAANAVLANGFIDTLHKKFMKPPASLEDAHIAVSAEED